VTDRDTLELKAAAAVELGRRRAKADLYWFAREILGYQDLNPKLHGEELVPFITRKGRQRLVLLPRGHLKSTLATIANCLWRIIQNPNIRILLANAVESNAESFLREIKAHITGNESFQRFFPEFTLENDGWTRWKSQTITAKRSKRMKEPTISIVGMGGALASQHYDLIIMDDLVERSHVETEGQLEKAKLWYKDALDLLEPDGELIYIGTRWHDVDLAGWLIDEHSDSFKFEDGSSAVMVRQAIEDDKCIFPEKFSKEILAELKRLKGPWEYSCNPAEAPVWMANGTFKPISEVRPGDKVIGFERGCGRKGGAHNRLVVSEVLATGSKLAPVQTLVFESGRWLRCTPDHRWYTGRNDGSHKLYKPARVGSVLFRAVHPADISMLPLVVQKWWRYLAGIIDGEGSCKFSNVVIHQSETDNGPVCRAIDLALKMVGAKCSTKTKPKPERIMRYWIVNGARQFRSDLINYGEPAKREQILRGIIGRSKAFPEKERVAEILPPGPAERVYSMQTTTGNYVVWGIGSKNCQYMNDPLPESEVCFKKGWWVYYAEGDFPRDDMNQLLPRRRYITIDPAWTTNRTSDFTGIIVNCVTPDDHWYLVDAFRLKITSDQLLDLLFELYGTYKPHLIGLEIHAMQRIFRDMLPKEIQRRGIPLPIYDLKPSGGAFGLASKGERIIGLQPRMSNGFIHWPTKANDSRSLASEGLEILRNQMLRFRYRHTSKKMVDNLLDALAYQIDIAQAPIVTSEEELPERAYNQFTGAVA